MKHLLCCIILSMLSFNIKAQLHASIGYNNRTINYKDASGLNGFQADVMYKTTNTGNFGFEYSYNRVTSKKYENVLLLRRDFDTKYHEVSRYNSPRFIDSTTTYKEFRGRRNYVYESYSFKYFFKLYSGKSVSHFAGLNLGFNVLSEKMSVTDDSASGKYFYKKGSFAQPMIGLNYNTEIKLLEKTAFYFGANIRKSAFLSVTDIDYIDQSLTCWSLFGGIRYYFK